MLPAAKANILRPEQCNQTLMSDLPASGASSLGFKFQLLNATNACACYAPACKAESRPLSSATAGQQTWTGSGSLPFDPAVTRYAEMESRSSADE